MYSSPNNGHMRRTGGLCVEAVFIPQVVMKLLVQ